MRIHNWKAIIICATLLLEVDFVSAQVSRVQVPRKKTSAPKNVDASIETFKLKIEKLDRIFGPYEYKNGAPVKIGKTELELIVPADQRQFSLKSEKNNKVYGPFILSDGNRFVLGQTELTIVSEKKRKNDKDRTLAATQTTTDNGRFVPKKIILLPDIPVKKASEAEEKQAATVLKLAANNSMRDFEVRKIMKPIQSVATVFPEVRVSLKPGEVEYSSVQLNTRRLGADGVRFTIPEGTKTLLCAYTYPQSIGF